MEQDRFEYAQNPVLVSAQSSRACLCIFRSSYVYYQPYPYYRNEIIS